MIQQSASNINHNTAATEEGQDEANAEDTPSQKFNLNNKCNLLWTGLTLKRSFHSFMFQTASNSDTARKILQVKGVGHYWDQLIHFLSGDKDYNDDQEYNIRLNLLREDDDDDSSVDEMAEGEDDKDEDDDNGKSNGKLKDDSDYYG